MKSKIGLALTLLLFPIFDSAKAGEPPPTLVKVIVRQ